MERKLRPILDQTCQSCGRSFHAQRRDAKYCCNACRQQGYLTRSAPKFVQRQLTYIEEEFRTLETRRGYLTRQNVDYVFERIKELVNGWQYGKLPYEHELRRYVECTLVIKLDALRARLLR